jgi:glutaryl-CoA dehydrogenase
VEYGGAGLGSNFLRINYKKSSAVIPVFVLPHRYKANTFTSRIQFKIWKRRATHEIFTKISHRRIYRLFWFDPNYGSDPGSMITNFKDMGDHYLEWCKKCGFPNAPLLTQPAKTKQEEFTD